MRILLVSLAMFIAAASARAGDDLFPGDAFDALATSGTQTTSDASVTDESTFEPAIADQPACVVRIYPVPELVIPLDDTEEPTAPSLTESSPYATSPQPVEVPREQKILEKLADLSLIVQSMIARDTWESVGGPGAVTIHASTRSLIVRQTPDVHAEIAAFLDELTRVQTREVAVRLEVITFDSDEKYIRYLKQSARHEAPRELIAALEEEGLSATPWLSLRLPNGVQITHLTGVSCEAIVLRDQRCIRLELSHAGERHFLTTLDGMGITEWMSGEQLVLLVAHTRLVDPHRPGSACVHTVSAPAAPPACKPCAEGDCKASCKSACPADQSPSSDTTASDDVVTK